MASSAWSPLAVPTFRDIWTATVVSNIGTWLSAVGTTWLMTVIAPSPFMVTLVQAASTLPIFLFGLPAGALADIIDRRRLLIGLQVFMMAIATTLWATVALGHATPGALLLATFLTGRNSITPSGPADSDIASQEIAPSTQAKR